MSPKNSKCGSAIARHHHLIETEDGKKAIVYTKADNCFVCKAIENNKRGINRESIK